VTCAVGCCLHASQKIIPRMSRGPGIARLHRPAQCVSMGGAGPGWGGVMDTERHVIAEGSYGDGLSRLIWA
jgi:hypothetical protein